MVDPLGLRVDRPDRRGQGHVVVSDYPHNESTFGYSEKSLAAVVDAVGPANAARIVSGNIKNSWACDGDNVRASGLPVLVIPDDARPGPDAPRDRGAAAVRRWPSAASTR